MSNNELHDIARCFDADLAALKQRNELLQAEVWHSEEIIRNLEVINKNLEDENKRLRELVRNGQCAGGDYYEQAQWEDKARALLKGSGEQAV